MADKKGIKALNNLVGKTIKSVDYTGEYSAKITIYFTDGTTLDIDAFGDDMAHIEFEIKK